MELKVEVSNEAFAKVITEGIQAIPKEEMKEICKECVKQYILKDEKIEGIFFEKSGGWNSKLTPTYYLKELLKEGFDKEELADIRSQILNTVEREKRQIILDCLLSAFANHLVTEDFVNSIRDSIASSAALTQENAGRIQNLENKIGI